MLQSVLDRNSNTKKSHELWTSRCNLFKYCAENVSYLLGNSYEVAVSLKRAANHCTFLQVHILLWFISLQLCTEKYRREIQSYVWHLQTTELPVLCSSDKARLCGEVGRQCLSLLSAKDVITDQHFILTLLCLG